MNAFLDHFAGFVVRRARVVLAVWLVAVAALAAQGLDLGDRLSAEQPIAADGPAARAQALTERAFGAEDALVVMLRGPQRQLDRDGPRVQRALAAVPRTHVVTPWNADGVMRGLRPDPQTAVVVVNVGRAAGEDPVDALARVRAAVGRTVHPPLRADLTGSSAISAATADAASDAIRTGVVIAVAILLLVVLALLVVFRSALALVPAVVGATTVAASRGVLELLSGPVDMTAVAAGLATIVGAGLGAGYPLLVVARFREEARATGDLVTALRATVATTGRAVPARRRGADARDARRRAGAARRGPDATAVAVAVAALMSAVASIVVVPALLALFAPHPASRTRPSKTGRCRAPRHALVGAAGAGRRGDPAHAGAGHRGRVGARHRPAERPVAAVRRPRARPARGRGGQAGPGLGAPLTIVVDGRGRPVTQPGG